MYQFRTILFIALAFITGCAGPMSPFGAVNTGSEPTLEEFTSDQKAEYDNHSVTFIPDRQVLHSNAKLEIKIDSTDKIQDSHVFKIYYNSKDVTKSYLKRSNKSVVLDSKQIDMAFRNLRLPASRDHKIVVAFQPSPDSSLVLAKYLPPVCLKDDNMDILTTGSFSPPSDYLLWIKASTKVRGINPNLMAGLIAQESGFNETSVSWARAIGLTQMTSAAEEEIISQRPTWPRYSKISNMSPAQLKTFIASKKINADNEWRLDPRKSIDGGTLYIEYLTNYWEKPENAQLLKSNFSDLEWAKTSAILASYNSGAARVKRAIQSDGKDFLTNEELTEARKYVNRIMSYCYHFSKKEG